MESIKNNKSGENVEIRNPSYDEFVQLANSPDVKSHEINYIDSILSTSLRAGKENMCKIGIMLGTAGENLPSAILFMNSNQCDKRLQEIARDCKR